MHFKAFLSNGFHLFTTIFFQHKYCLFESVEKAIIHVQNVMTTKTYDLFFVEPYIPWCGT